MAFNKIALCVLLIDLREGLEAKRKGFAWGHQALNSNVMITRVPQWGAADNGSQSGLATCPLHELGLHPDEPDMITFKMDLGAL